MKYKGLKGEGNGEIKRNRERIPKSDLCSEKDVSLSRSKGF